MPLLGFGNFLFNKPRRDASSGKIFGCAMTNWKSWWDISPFCMPFITSTPPARFAPASCASLMISGVLDSTRIERSCPWSNLCGIATIRWKLSTKRVWKFTVIISNAVNSSIFLLFLIKRVQNCIPYYTERFHSLWHYFSMGTCFKNESKTSSNVFSSSSREVAALWWLFQIICWK